MKKSLFVILVGITVLACSLFSPTAAPTPQVDAVFRSPRDLNLQPLDVPDLQEVPVEQPADSALLPEAIDQDQRAYVNLKQNVYIESSVILVPGRTTRAPAELAQEIVRNRDQEMKILGDEKIVSLGEQGVVIRIGENCSSDYSDGYILVFYRNNMVVTIIACGDVNEKLITFLAARIESRANRPPATGEVMGKKTIQAILYPSPTVESTAAPTDINGTQTAQANPCANLDPSLSDIEKKHCQVSYEMISCVYTHPEWYGSPCSTAVVVDIYTILTSTSGYARVTENVYCQFFKGSCAWKFIYTETGVNVEMVRLGSIEIRAYYEIR